MVDFRTLITVDESALAHNYNLIRESAHGAKVMAVVKADAYGHGAARVARRLFGAGADFFAVATVGEAVELREAGIKGDILILGYTPLTRESAEALVFHNITQTVFSREYADGLSSVLREPVKVHIKVDTGMARLGFAYTDKRGSETIDEIAEICAYRNLITEGIFTHIATADADDLVYAKRQGELFAELIARLAERGIVFGIKHASNSAAVFTLPELALDYVRAGIALYGYGGADLRPVMKVESVIAQIHEVKRGEAVGYSRTFTAERDMKVAVVPFGYADGLPRSLSNRGRFMVNGQEARIVGNICMDMTMIDVSGIVCRENDKAVILGDGVTADEIASIVGTISYEVLCGMGNAAR
ncbi:alanine racemase 1 [Clostridia bacterium]|nr:alanine racemase 1 [Clostridia bacterium]